MVFTPIDIEKEYEKDKNLKREDVVALMEWASKLAHLPKITASMVPMLDLNLNGTCPGYIIIADSEGTHMGHMAKFNINVARKYLFLLQEAVPYRLFGFHMLNAPPYIHKLLSLVRPFMKKELFEMLHFHTSIEDLCKYVPKECLPEELGGEAPTFLKLQQNTNELIKNNIDFFRELGTQTVNESKRQAKLKNELFGIDGSFKKLDFD